MEISRASGCRPESEEADFSDAVPAPKLIPFRRILRVGVDNHTPAIPASDEEHAFHLMELEFLLVLLPGWVAVLAHRVADLAEEETADHC